MEISQERGDGSPLKSNGEDEKVQTVPPLFWKRRPVIIAGIVILAGLFYIGLHYLAFSFTHESTDDAFLDSTVASMAPQVAGRVKAVHVVDNQAVKAGDLLVEIDPRDFEVALEKKKAAKLSADDNTKLIEASLDLLKTQVATAEATVKQSEAEAAADKAKADQADADLKRAEDLFQKKITSSQEYDAAKAAAQFSEATLQASQQKAASDQSKVAETRAELEAGRRAWERAQAQAAEAGVDVREAELNLSYTRVTAPEDGRVTRKAVEDGDYVQVGQKLMAIVENDIRVSANFKETQLEKMRPGQPVSIEIDSVGRTFRGHVDSIQAGSGAAFSLLPPENAVGNFVKVVQRVPVRILFDNPVDTEHVVGPGMSVVPSVWVTSFEVPAVVVTIVAILLALAAGYFWSRAADGNRPAA